MKTRQYRPVLVPIAHWHIPLDGLSRELSLIFYGRQGKTVTLQDLDTIAAFLQIARQQRVTQMQDYEI